MNLENNTKMKTLGPQAARLVTQPQLVVHVTTLEKRRPINILGTDFQFITCKKEHFFGMNDHWVSKQKKVSVSNMEKTIIDGLRQPEYCGGITETAKGI